MHGTVVIAHGEKADECSLFSPQHAAICGNMPDTARATIQWDIAPFPLRVMNIAFM